MNFKLILLVLLTWCQFSFAGTTRTIDADAISSSNKSYTYSFSSITGNVQVSTAWVQESPSGTINGTNTAFTTSYAPAQAATLVVSVDGIIQLQSTDYTISSNTITFTTAPAVGQTILVTYYRF